MNPQLQNDLDQLDRLLALAQSESSEHLHALRDMPTSRGNRVPMDMPLPDKGIGGQRALEKFKLRFKDILVGSPGPRYWGYVTGGSTPASIMGDWLASAYDQNTQATQGQGDISAQIEVEAIQLLLELLGLPKTFGGGFVTGAMMSNFSCLATARQWLGHEHGLDVAKKGLFASPPLPVLGSSPHSSAIKALSLLGLGKENFTYIPNMGGGREAMDPQLLEKGIKALKGAPFILVSSAATVNSGDFDAFGKIAELRERYRFWWHIDAAFGGLVACSPKYRQLIQGWEGADSITVDCHKWLNVPYENAVYLIKTAHHGLQLESFQNSNAPYLGKVPGNINYLDLLPENSRRLKALPVWFTLVAYGKEGYRDLVEGCIELAQDLGRRINRDPRMELLAPVHLNIVPFTVKGATDTHLDGFLQQLNARGKLFLTPTVFDKRKGFRAALVNWRTTKGDIDLAMEEISATLEALGMD